LNLLRNELQGKTFHDWRTQGQIPEEIKFFCWEVWVRRAFYGRNFGGVEDFLLTLKGWN